MKNPLQAKAAIAIFCLGVLFWSGCAGFLKPERGAVARPEARIGLREESLEKQKFSAGDVTILYSLSGAGDPFSLSGTLMFDRSLTNAFPIIDRFSLKMSFLDGEGRVIETVDITPVFGAFSRMPEKLDLRVSREAPPGSRAIAFNYFGVFRSNLHEAAGDSWEIFYFPYER